MPVEEAQHHFHSLIINPLYDANETSQRDKEGMLQITELYMNHGMAFRYYGILVRDKHEGGVQKKIYVELSGVERGVIILITEDGSKQKMLLTNLTDEDVGFLIDNLTGSDKGLLWDGEGGRIPSHRGTELRAWTLKANNKKATGKLSRIGKGVVTLFVYSGRDRHTIENDRPVEDFVEAGRAFLRGLIAPQDRAVLWPACDGNVQQQYASVEQPYVLRHHADRLGAYWDKDGAGLSGLQIGRYRSRVKGIECHGN